MKETKVAFVIPAYNESEAIGDVIKSLKKALKPTKIYYEIVVVDDGSKDNTATLAEQNGAFVIRHILNSKTGSATATGLSYAQQAGFEMAVTLDADGQHSPQDTLKGIELMQKDGADLLIGSRLIDPTGMSSIKRIGNKGLSLITYLLFGINVTDSQSGLRVFSRQALEKLKWKTSGFEFCSEMLWRAKQQGLTIKEFPIKAIYTDYSKAKGQNNWNAFRIVNSLVRRRIVEMFGE